VAHRAREPALQGLRLEHLEQVNGAGTVICVTPTGEIITWKAGSDVNPDPRSPFNLMDGATP
jgi:hypothetical protein